MALQTIEFYPIGTVVYTIRNFDPYVNEMETPVIEDFTITDMLYSPNDDWGLHYKVIRKVSDDEYDDIFDHIRHKHVFTTKLEVISGLIEMMKDNHELVISRYNKVLNHLEAMEIAERGNNASKL